MKKSTLSLSSAALTSPLAINLTGYAHTPEADIIGHGDWVVFNPGDTAPVYQNGVLQPLFQTENTFCHGHDVCVDEDRNLYACQWNANKTYPVRLERV